MKLRFTGEWPPQSLWESYPNWEYALDEEGIDGQDETSLKASMAQDYIAEDVAFTAGFARQANGVELPALLEINFGKCCGVEVFVAPTESWSVRLLGSPGSWVCVSRDWIPPDQRGPVVSPDDATVFPLLLQSRVPMTRGGKQMSITVTPSGTV